MEFYVSSSQLPIDPIPETLDEEISALTSEEASFFVVSENETTYLQATWNDSDGFYLEYQNGDIEQHYHIEERLALPLVIEIANRYLKGDTSWRSHPSWVHDPLEAQAEEAQGLVRLGNFEDIAARRAIAALEKQGIEFLVNHEGNAFVLYASAEIADQARRVLDHAFENKPSS